MAGSKKRFFPSAGDPVETPAPVEPTPVLQSPQNTWRPAGLTEMAIRDLVRRMNRAAMPGVTPTMKASVMREGNLVTIRVPSGMKLRAELKDGVEMATATEADVLAWTMP